MKILTVGEAGQLVGCYGLYSNNPEYNLSIFLDMDKEKIYRLQHSMKTCKKCCDSNAAWYSHNFWKYHDKDIEDVVLFKIMK